ncbi:bifunctional adenosylcobinamide kinase/adenosylcobinamide-phosphate guanylyltransferase [Mediterraneibacter glycyrrhizinilyticus]|nr:bifunctional adenosylcobinamide kinase/adenosylcobinamide-phosphate guanylyltransferase [Mediterraneibacter glycyrrhizinilyticus]MCB6309192.1 bifunctional adenosylcobinamide kinase/adenosylcobinamide-phosphate guanylyltransferase [Lachnospiraceae bacterium 210521-DFI.1.109]MCB6426263.1 bifunctional adenosylcobinamide kinase/adenosylcobinamide-phosphate guanylyltransferase [Mediterraneibacter glycyrrhizinilyticus]
MDDIWEAEGILHLEAWISRWMRGEENKARQQKEKISCQAEEEVGRLVRRLIETNPDRVIVCTEIGYGLVPVDAFDRAYRETVGRICTGLAGKAAAVDRIVCGIDTRIKEM